MKTEQSASRTASEQTDIDLIVTSIQKLDRFFADDRNADHYLQSNGWLNREGMERLRQRWTPYALCVTLLKMSCSTLPKTKDNAKAICDRTREFGCVVSLRETAQGAFFAVEGLNFFWFGA